LLRKASVRTQKREENRRHGTVQARRALLLAAVRSERPAPKNSAYTLPNAEKVEYHMACSEKAQSRTKSCSPKLLSRRARISEGEMAQDCTSSMPPTMADFVNAERMYRSAGFPLRREFRRWLGAAREVIRLKARTRRTRKKFARGRLRTPRSRFQGRRAHIQLARLNQEPIAGRKLARLRAFVGNARR